ncbi:DUF1036 domain-containing protein [Bacillus thuringiensis]|uniref:DUF1036 domain-containing protein n=1 Tax=Bacillus thuringiensis TaxID=1428 RepID=UPI002248FA13|nr:DUF1036 domain-containing protein [Bacillus thuringiensis]
MSLQVKNDSGRTVWVAIAFEEPDCSGTRWRKKGWWKIGPRATETVFGESAKNRGFRVFAIDDRNENYTDGTFFTDLPNDAFSRCWDERGGQNYGMFGFYSTKKNHIHSVYI